MYEIYEIKLRTKISAITVPLYRNPIQVGNFGGTFDQLFIWIFLCRRCLSTFSILWCKKVKNDQNPKSREGLTMSGTHTPYTSIINLIRRPSEWGLYMCALRHGIQTALETILAARSTEGLDCHPKSCELWRNRTGTIPGSKTFQSACMPIPVSFPSSCTTAGAMGDIACGVILTWSVRPCTAETKAARASMTRWALSSTAES